MNLQEQIDNKSKEIHSDSYSMSIGELASLYRDGEIDIHPDFQRIYRWSNSQRTKLIESILLGIPIPSIFVSQREDGVWDIVDGLQRLSTIFQFMGILKNEKNEILSPLVLESTKYLPSLSDKVWQSEIEDISFTLTQRLLIKRSKINIQIVKRESDKDAKYELFQRLNTGGSRLSDQEVRNCILVMLDIKKFFWLKELSENTNFQESISITERSLKSAYHQELILRFMIYRHSKPIDISRSSELNELITDKMISYVEDIDFDFDNEKEIFLRTFDLLYKALGDRAFRKYSSTTLTFKGPFSISAFEAIIPGLSENIDKYNDENVHLIAEKIKAMWANPEFDNHSGAGLRSADRVKHLIPLSKKMFKI